MANRQVLFSEKLVPKPIPVEIREAIVRAWEANEGSYEDLAVRFDVGVASISRFLRRFRTQGSLEPDVQKHRGRPSKLDEAGRKILAEEVAANQKVSAMELRDRLRLRTGVVVCEGTIRDHLLAMGLRRKRLPPDTSPDTEPAAAQPAPEFRYQDRHRAQPPDRPHRQSYPSDTTDPQWRKLAPLLRGKVRSSGRDVEERDVVDAILYVLRTGCPWRYLPHDLPPYRLVHKHFRRWATDGTWERVNAVLRVEVRRREGRNDQPTAAIIDSQSVKTAEKGGSVATMRARRSTEESGSSS